MKVKEENEKGGLKLSFRKTKICYSIPSLHSECGKSGNSDNFIFLGSKITEDGDCSHETKIHLLLGRKAITNLTSILKNGGITLHSKIHTVKAMIFLVVMYGCENWTIKKAQLQKIGGFNLLSWRRLLSVPWAARSNQSILKEINPEYSLEGLILKLKLQYFGYLIQETTHYKRP